MPSAPDTIFLNLNLLINRVDSVRAKNVSEKTAKLKNLRFYFIHRRSSNGVDIQKTRCYNVRKLKNLSLFKKITPPAAGQRRNKQMFFNDEDSMPTDGGVADDGMGSMPTGEEEEPKEEKIDDDGDSNAM